MTKEKCVAAKGAKFSSWLLPQNNCKLVEIIQNLKKTNYIKLWLD